MQVWALLADWNRLDEVWRDAAEEPNFNALAEEEDWISDDSYTLENDSAVISEAAGRMFSKMHGHLSLDEYNALGTFLAAFSMAFFEEDELRDFRSPCDLPYPRFIYYSVISPTTVTKLIELREHFDLNKLRSIAEKVEPPQFEYWISPDEFIEYIEMWTNVLREADEMNRGILVGCG